MAGIGEQQAHPGLAEIKGALDVLFTLREEFAQWVEEAQDEARKEELDNVYQHILVMEGEYRRRFDAAEKALNSA